MKHRPFNHGRVSAWKVGSAHPTSPASPFRLPTSDFRLPTSSRRSGFTLVELLIVIVIIGMLAALITAAAARAVGAAKRTQITLDLDQFETAFQSYRNDTSGNFPPDLSYPANTASFFSYQIRQNRIMAHLRKAYPRALFVDKSGTTANGYGPPTGAALAGGPPNGPPAGPLGTAPFSLQGWTQNWFQNLPIVLPGTTPSGDTWGNVDNLDPAEALVFWLGGMPIPFMDGGGKWSFKMAGFSANKQAPFAAGGSRSPGPYEFAPARLGDADGDGWPEYYPPSSAVPQPPGSAFQVGNPAPPYVYFDAASYNAVAIYDSGAASGTISASGGYNTYPSPYPMNASGLNGGNAARQPITHVTDWGLAVPYAMTIVPTSGTTGAVAWVNDKKFQLISGGLDAEYASVACGTTYRANFPLFPTPQQTSPLPGIFTLDVNDAVIGETDNLTNFFNGTLFDGSQP